MAEEQSRRTKAESEYCVGLEPDYACMGCHKDRYMHGPLYGCTVHAVCSCGTAFGYLIQNNHGGWGIVQVWASLTFDHVYNDLYSYNLVITCTAYIPLCMT